MDIEKNLSKGTAINLMVEELRLIANRKDLTDNTKRLAILVFGA